MNNLFTRREYLHKNIRKKVENIVPGNTVKPGKRSPATVSAL